MKRLLLCMVLYLLGAPLALAQEATETPADEPQFVFDFPVAPPTDEQIEAAYLCPLRDETGENNEITGLPGCASAQEALTENDPTEDDIARFIDAVEANPALPLRLDLIAIYFGLVPLAPSPFEDQVVTSVHVRYTFSGIGNQVNYDITLTDDGDESLVSGEVMNTGMDDTAATPEVIAEMVDSDLVQAFGAALTDLLPIETEFETIVCFDYYPNWQVTLTFADGSEVEVVNNGSNVVGIGGPWQSEIDGQAYMQYSAAFSEPLIALFEALDLRFGETAAMSCGGVDEPLHQAYPRELD